MFPGEPAPPVPCHRCHRSVRCDLTDDVVPAVRDIDVPKRVDSEASRPVEPCLQSGASVAAIAATVAARDQLEFSVRIHADDEVATGSSRPLLVYNLSFAAVAKQGPEE